MTIDPGVQKCLEEIKLKVSFGTGATRSDHSSNKRTIQLPDKKFDTEKCRSLKTNDQIIIELTDLK